MSSPKESQKGHNDPLQFPPAPAHKFLNLVRMLVLFLDEWFAKTD
jgi:hypothetical protein